MIYSRQNPPWPIDVVIQARWDCATQAHQMTAFAQRLGRVEHPDVGAMAQQSCLAFTIETGGQIVINSRRV